MGVRVAGEGGFGAGCTEQRADVIQDGAHVQNVSNSRRRRRGLVLCVARPHQTGIHVAVGTVEGNVRVPAANGKDGIPVDESQMIIGEEVVSPFGMGWVAVMLEGMEGTGVYGVVFFGRLILDCFAAGRGGGFGLGFGLGFVGLGLRLGSGSC